MFPTYRNMRYNIVCLKCEKKFVNNKNEVLIYSGRET